MRHTRSVKLLLSLFIFVSATAFAQKDTGGRIYWNARQKLIVDDFGIKTKNMESGPTSVEFAIDYDVSRFNFAIRNFNKKVRNFMVKATSQIDTTGNVQQYLLYQQTLFDLSEVYAREFRKALRENRKLLISGTKVADDLNRKIMSEFLDRRSRYTQESNAGNDPAKQKEWEDRIACELNELKDYAYDK